MSKECCGEGYVFCPQCNYEVTASTNRLIQDTCGHKKCRMCLLREENGCEACLRRCSNEIKYDISKACRPVESYIFETSDNALEEVKVITKLGSYVPHPPNEPPPLTPTCIADIKEDLVNKSPACIIPTKPFIKNNGVKPLKVKRKPLAIPSYITKSESSVEKYMCTICNKRFKGRLHIRYHLYCDGSAKPYRCSICGQEFISKSHYEYHLRNHEGSRPYICLTCQRTFNQQGKLTRHMRSHSEDRPFVCTNCGRGFKNSHSLKIHGRAHLAEKPYGCHVCSMRFTELSGLKRHLITHSGVKEFMCEECGKSYGLKASLNLHILTHSRVRAFACEACPRRFTCKKELKRHVITHANVRPYICRVCNQAFRRRDNFDRHMKNTHPTSRLPPTILKTDTFTNVLCSMTVSPSSPAEESSPQTTESLPSQTNENVICHTHNSKPSTDNFKASAPSNYSPKQTHSTDLQRTPVILEQTRGQLESSSGNKEQLESAREPISCSVPPAFQAVPVINRSNVTCLSTSPNIRFNGSSIIKMGASSISSEPTNCVPTITCTSDLRHNSVPTIVSPPNAKQAQVEKPNQPEPDPYEKPPLRLHLSDLHWRKRTMEMLNLRNKLKADSLVYDKSLEKVRDSWEERLVSSNARSEVEVCPKLYTSTKTSDLSPNREICDSEANTYQRPYRRLQLIPARNVDYHRSMPDDTRLFTLARVAETQGQQFPLSQRQAENVIVENKMQQTSYIRHYDGAVGREHADFSRRHYADRPKQTNTSVSCNNGEIPK